MSHADITSCLISGTPYSDTAIKINLDKSNLIKLLKTHNLHNARQVREVVVNDKLGKLLSDGSYLLPIGSDTKQILTQLETTDTKTRVANRIVGSGSPAHLVSEFDRIIKQYWLKQLSNKKCINDSEISVLEKTEKEQVHIKIIEQRLAGWVDWSKKSSIFTPKQALDAVKVRYGVSPLPQSFYDQLTTAPEPFTASLSRLSKAQQESINEAAILFFKSLFDYNRELNAPDLLPLTDIRSKFIKALIHYHGYFTINHEVDTTWEELGNPLDIYVTSVFSVARQMYKEDFGEEKAKKVDLIGKERSFLEAALDDPYLPSRVRERFTKSLESTPKDQYTFLAHYFNEKAKNWRPKFDKEGNIISKPHPYARIAAFMEDKVTQILDNINNNKYTFILSLPDGQQLLDNLKKELTTLKEHFQLSPLNEEAYIRFGALILQASKTKSHDEIKRIINDAHDLFRVSDIKNPEVRKFISAKTQFDELVLNIFSLGIYQVIKDSVALSREKPFISHWHNELKKRGRDTYLPDYYLEQEDAAILLDVTEVAINALTLFIPFGGEAAEVSEDIELQTFNAIADESASRGVSEELETSFIETEVPLGGQIKNKSFDAFSFIYKIIDRDFNKTIAEVRPSNVSRFHQSQVLLRWYSDLKKLGLSDLTDGVCNGLSINWAFEELQGENGTAALKWLEKLAESNKAIKNGTAIERQVRFNTINHIKEFQELQEAYKNYPGLEIGNVAQENGIILNGFDKELPAEMLNELKQGGDKAIVFSSPNHVMGLSKIGNKFRFFEPNYGTASFSNHSDLVSFTEKYLHRARKSLNLFKAGNAGKVEYWTFEKNAYSTQKTIYSQFMEKLNF